MPEIFESLFDALPVQSAEPIWTIAGRARCSIETAQRYVGLIIKIQSWPKVTEDQIGEQKGYRRQTQAGRPSKP